MCGISHYGFNTTIPGGFLAGPSIVTWGVYIYTHEDETGLVPKTPMANHDNAHVAKRKMEKGILSDFPALPKKVEFS